MQRVLFHETIFGPIHSRRLGASLGVNLSPNDGKICTFDCLYCEAGYNAQGPGTTGLPPRERVRLLLDEKLRAMREGGEPLDVITFSGNGEPTVHPDFGGVIDDVTALRDKYYPEVKISVLCNSTMLDRPAVVDALKKVDNCILKLDSAIDSTISRLDRPSQPQFTAERVIGQLTGFGKKAIIQTMMTRGSHDGIAVDNTVETEIDALIDAYRRIGPGEIMLYTIDRPTPERSLQRVPVDELRAIADRITATTSIPVQVTG